MCKLEHLLYSVDRVLFVFSSPAEPSIQTSGAVLTEPAGGTATLTCSADGVPTPSVTWFRNGQLVPGSLSERLKITAVVQTGGFQADVTEHLLSTLTISELTPDDDGNYSCSATNNVGATAILSIPYTLTVRPPRKWRQS